MEFSIGVPELLGVSVCVALDIIDAVEVGLGVTSLDEDAFVCTTNILSSACLELQSSSEQQTPAVSLITNTPLLARQLRSVKVLPHP